MEKPYVCSMLSQASDPAASSVMDGQGLFVRNIMPHGPQASPGHQWEEQRNQRPPQRALGSSQSQGPAVPCPVTKVQPIRPSTTALSSAGEKASTGQGAARYKTWLIPRYSGSEGRCGFGFAVLVHLLRPLLVLHPCSGLGAYKAKLRGLGSGTPSRAQGQSAVVP